MLAELDLAAERPARARRFAHRAIAYHRRNGYRPGEVQARALLGSPNPTSTRP